MKTKLFRFVVSSILVLGLAIPGAAFAGDAGKGCKNTGTWFGVDNLEDKIPTGWMATVTGQSADHGVNAFEYPTFNSALFGLPDAHGMSADRGVWQRLDGDTFAYSFMGIAVDENNITLYLLRVSGEVTVSSDCMSEEITALLEIFWPGNSPFVGEADLAWQLPVHYGYRYTLD